MNEYLKEIASICGINKTLTTHTARHTFACIALNNNIGVEIINAWMGHSSLSMTMHYAKTIKATDSREMDKMAGKFKPNKLKDTPQQSHLRVV